MQLQCIQECVYVSFPAGVDPHELVDTRPILKDMDIMLFNNYRGREEFANLPRKLNVCISSTRDDFPHTHINDVGYEAVRDASGTVMFNVLVSMVLYCTVCDASLVSHAFLLVQCLPVCDSEHVAAGFNCLLARCMAGG